MYPKHLFRFVRHFRTDRWYRTRVIVPTSMFMNAAFTIMYAVQWILDRSSDWFLFLAGYYGAMTSLRIHLTRAKNRIDSATTLEGARAAKEDTVRRTGTYLLAAAAAVALVSNQILKGDHNFYYPLWNLLILTGYSLTAFGLAISNLIHDHLEDWLIRSTRAVSMVGALTGIYVLSASIFLYTQMASEEIHMALQIESTIVFLIIVGISLRLILLPSMKEEFNLEDLVKKIQKAQNKKNRRKQ